MITKGIKDLVAEAEAEIETIAAEDAIRLMDDPDVELVDIRDIRELWREGAVPGARHVPRGMIEFWIDPDSPYHKPFFASGKKFVFFCAGRHALGAGGTGGAGHGAYAGRPHRRRLRRLEGGRRPDRGEAASVSCRRAARRAGPVRLRPCLPPIWPCRRPRAACCCCWGPPSASPRCTR